MTNDSWILGVAIVLVVFVLILVGPLIAAAVIVIALLPYNVYVARDFVVAAQEKPHIPFLTFSAVRSVALAIICGLATILSIHTILFYVSQGAVRILPQPVPLVFLVLIVLICSVVNLYYERVKRQRFEAGDDH